MFTREFCHSPVRLRDPFLNTPNASDLHRCLSAEYSPCLTKSQVSTQDRTLRAYLEHFFQTQTSTNPVFVLPKAEPKSVMHLLEFMYTGETRVEMDQLAEFGELANLLDVRILKELWPLESIEVKKEISDAEDMNMTSSPPPKNRARGGPKSKRKPVDFYPGEDSSVDFDVLENTAEVSTLASSSSNADHRHGLLYFKNISLLSAAVAVPVDRLAMDVPPQFDVMEIMKTQKGYYKLAYKGYVYRKHASSVDRVSWRCEHRNCKGRATTPIDFEEYQGRDVVTITQLHSHPASTVRVEVLRARTKALNAATGNQAPEEIVANAVAGLSEEALSKESVPDAHENLYMGNHWPKIWRLSRILCVQASFGPLRLFAIMLIELVNVESSIYSPLFDVDPAFE
ncbi:unnamed protein product [Notodromas monacha]|uniref:FLYWCH-type domain-containing protein n=1 Tax=Notodromas monacha TaxID=399045 RepID=A0A7R9BEZ8_9CRUS|nr:unnamed protein product [Notodromas monacha]CAG0912595.1 unnamed protein product [Notodromas monacha]